ncbi:hypothetical protein SAMN04487859_14115 [Roseovarius lutimaris]|uniref:Uncharacterized protein n=1 Tax=Roseovarius lutimaris TaxID=1005928 RepID=A0A1I5GWL6_9RHOB|nr:hypothetical protein [Roseovarius lutimaris]SFO40216.1 hypothetical protein SAMN04487859_14115 [Roseovarius lutimaris]
MIDTDDFNTRLERLQTALRERMRLRGRTLEAQLRRAGRRLPKRQRRAGAIVLGAQDWMAHPKLARVLDISQVNAAFADLHAHLDTIDPKEDRKTAILRLFGGVVLNLALLVILLVLVIKWQGAM